MILYMVTAFITIGMFILGAVLGSFAIAQMWRIRARDTSIKDGGPRYLKSLRSVSFMRDRSKCLSCGYLLKWYDMIPLVSWLVYRGRCRQCHKQIGKIELAMELLLGLLFAVSYAYWPIELTNTVAIAQFGGWLIALVLFAILSAYDLRWYLLPNTQNYSLIGVGAVMSILTISAVPDKPYAALSVGGALLVLSGLYYALYVISKGKWIGSGDIILGAGLALVLSDWTLAVLALFIANLAGTLIVIPGMMLGRLKGDSRVPFGPLLIFGTVIAMLFGRQIIDFYLSLVII